MGVKVAVFAVRKGYMCLIRTDLGFSCSTICLRPLILTLQYPCAHLQFQTPSQVAEWCQVLANPQGPDISIPDFEVKITLLHSLAFEMYCLLSNCSWPSKQATHQQYRTRTVCCYSFVTLLTILGSQKQFASRYRCHAVRRA